MKEIQNPVLRGFHPDPSAVCVDGVCYVAVSTFEWWPGIEIYRSADLARWELAAQPLRSENQADLRGDFCSGGIWAPHLSFSEGKFWLAFTDVKAFSVTAFLDAPNYVIRRRLSRAPGAARCL